MVWRGRFSVLGDVENWQHQDGRWVESSHSLWIQEGLKRLRSIWRGSTWWVLGERVFPADVGRWDEGEKSVLVWQPTEQESRGRRALKNRSYDFTLFFFLASSGWFSFWYEVGGVRNFSNNLATFQCVSPSSGSLLFCIMAGYHHSSLSWRSSTGMRENVTHDMQSSFLFQ